MPRPPRRSHCPRRHRRRRLPRARPATAAATAPLMAAVPLAPAVVATSLVTTAQLTGQPALALLALSSRHRPPPFPPPQRRSRWSRRMRLWRDWLRLPHTRRRHSPTWQTR